MIRYMMLALSVLLGCGTVAVADTVTLNGIPLFDTSLGVLQKAKVTIDPTARDLSPSILVTSVSAHGHMVDFPSFSVFGATFQFGQVQSSVESAPANIFHSHSFDPSPMTVVFEGAALSDFLPDTAPILRPTAVFLPGGTAAESKGHFHLFGDSSLIFDIVATTTFEYTQIPEPRSVVGIFIGAMTTWPALRKRQ